MLLPRIQYPRDIFGVYVLGDNGGRYKSNSSSFLVSDPRDTDWYRIIHATGQAQWFPPHENSYVVSTPYTSYVSMGIPFIDKATGRTKGVVLADIDSDKLSDIAARAVSGTGDVFLMDERNRGHLGVPSIVIPYAAADQKNHAPNESMVLSGFFKGIRTSAALPYYLAKKRQA